jgi:glucosyl-dolichyl phosphate glucuronosyltransferase
LTRLFALKQQRRPSLHMLTASDSRTSGRDIPTVERSESNIVNAEAVTMKVTVILCTYNRCERLASALESVLNSTLPASVQWEVLVVDNNSSDLTKSVVEESAHKHPGRLIYLFEPRQGKSYALNTGIKAAQGNVLAFMDDDVEVDREWLGRLVAKLNDRNWAGTGGRVLPQMGFVPPPWMDARARYGLAPLAIFDLGPEAGELREAPFGTNMAFRKEMFGKHGTFRTDLGPQPGSEIRNEDSEFGSRLLAAGEHLWYEPSAVVYHHIPECRTQRQYFQKWWFDKARGDIRQSGFPKDTKWIVAGIPFYLFRRLARWTMQWTTSLREPARFSSKLQVWGLAGSILECYKQSQRTVHNR